MKIKWPDNPQDAKALYLSIVASAMVAIVIISKDVMEILFKSNSKIMLVTLWILLWYIFIKFLKKYRNISDRLDKIKIDSKKNKKKVS